MKKSVDETPFALRRRCFAAIVFAALPMVSFAFVAANILSDATDILALLLALLPNLPLIFSAARFRREPASTESIAWAGMSIAAYGFGICCVWYTALLGGLYSPEGWLVLLPCALAFGVPTAVLAGTVTAPRQLWGLTPFLMFLALGVAAMILPALMG